MAGVAADFAVDHAPAGVQEKAVLIVGIKKTIAAGALDRIKEVIVQAKRIQLFANVCTADLR